MTYLQMINEVLRIANLKTVSALDETSDATAVGERLNTTQGEMATAADWWFTLKSGSITTAAGTESYSVATDVFKILAAKQTVTPSYIKPVPRDMIELVYPDRSAGNHQGDPKLIALDAATTTGSPAASLQKVILYPVPNSVMTITYLYSMVLSDMSTAAGQSLVPVRWHYGMVLGAAEKTLWALPGGESRAPAFSQKYGIYVQDMKRKERVFNDEDLRWFMSPTKSGPFGTLDPLNQWSDF